MNFLSLATFVVGLVIILTACFTLPVTDPHANHLWFRGILLIIASAIFAVGSTIKEKNFRG